MKKTRILLSFMLAGMLSLSMLTACGGNDSSKSTDTEKSKASQTADGSKENSVSTGETEEDPKPPDVLDIMYGSDRADLQIQIRVFSLKHIILCLRNFYTI